VLNRIVNEEFDEGREVPIDESEKDVAYLMICFALVFTMWTIAAYAVAGEMTLTVLFLGLFWFLVILLMRLYGIQTKHGEPVLFLIP
jgi:hypothetical protein